MDTSELLPFAEQLVQGDKPSPAACRTAISRAYYAAFHPTREFLVRIEVRIPKDGSTHRAVCKYVINVLCKAFEVPDLSRIQALSGKRVEADYDLDSTTIESVALAKGCIESSKKFLIALDVVKGLYYKKWQAMEPSEKAALRHFNQNWKPGD